MTKNTNKRIIHHAAQGCADFPPSSLSALESCLSQGALAIEVDTFPTADGHYVLLHDLNLENHTNGSGNAAALKRKDLEILSYKTHGQPTHEKLGFLDEAVGLISQNTSIEKFQLDLKPYGKLDAAALEKLVGLIDPIKTKVQVSSVADWLIRTLHNIEPGLSLGFDPLLYIDKPEDEPRPESVPPFRVGAYGYLDDHPLAARKWGSLKDYFAARAEALMLQAVPGCEWFIRADMLLDSARAGFDWISYLHKNGFSVDAWTLDSSSTAGIDMANELIALGIDEITSNTAKTLAESVAAVFRY